MASKAQRASLTSMTLMGCFIAAFSPKTNQSTSNQMKSLIPLLFCLLMPGCESPQTDGPAKVVFGSGANSSQDLYKVSVGMTKAELFRALGKPHSAAADGPVEYLIYNLDNERMGGKSEYFIRLMDGRVNAFGKKGDFDTTIKPVDRKEITIRKQELPPPK